MRVSGPGIDPRHFDHYSALVMRFSFKGHNKLCASWMVASSDLEAEIIQAASRPLAQHKNEVVRKVELVGCDGGVWDYNEWPDGLRLLSDYFPTTMGEPEPEPE